MEIRVLLTRVVVSWLTRSGIHNPRGVPPSVAKSGANALCRPPDDRSDRSVRGTDALALKAVKNLIHRHFRSGYPRRGRESSERVVVLPFAVSVLPLHWSIADRDHW